MCSRIRRLNVKTPIIPNLIYRFNAIPIKTPENFLKAINKLILKCMWKVKGIRRAKPILKKED